ncbi:hypothetical protein QIS99_21940 [Streptomyces sp. B-S-A8]|uniref:Transferase n=1 Tax=Streptomyces solicavernae TaxID=3043614 RepID=A0ABT6RWL5_9ACTN|nr:hypothetical protein [Streptomyces sp. B-S-A8]MDI3388833.1 hypothetical protein [Streptomyces sp. B-S-A8]
MTALLPPPLPDEVHDRVPVEPRADCVADSAGGLTFDLADLGRPGAAYLLLRLRERQPHGAGHTETRLPLTPAADGRLRAVLPSSVQLAEGRWDVYADHGDAAPRRLAPGVNDLRSLVDRMPSGTRPHIAVRIPYATKHGNLTVRAWHRAPHAEAGELLIDGAGLTVRGRLLGAPLTPAGYAELRARTPEGDSPGQAARRVELGGSGGEFGLTVGYAELADAPGIWDLWLLPQGAQGPQARVARLLDDVADKKPIFTYPAVRTGPVAVGPYYTRDNDLSLRVTEAG